MASQTFKNFRIVILLLVLAFVALQTWLTHVRATDWQEPLWVVVYPINGDGSSDTARYINNLDEPDFSDIETFFSREAKRYGLTIETPVTVKLAPPLNSQPPAPPEGGSTLDVVMWSLQMRYWAFSNNNFDGPRPDIQMFVVYFDPRQQSTVKHSLGLKKGMLGVVNAFASNKMSGSNNVIIAHELLHTLGATDKYDPQTNMPLLPVGYIEPDSTPLYPQRWAELMAGRRAITASQAETPQSLRQVAIGIYTANEIKWMAM